MLPASRAVFRELLRRELEERYRGSLLGAAWLLLLPLLQLLVLAWVFGHLLPARAASGDLPYAAFLALGLWPWNLFANAASRGVTALTDNAALIGKVAVPHALYIDARVAGAVVVDLAGFVVVLVVLALLGTSLALAGVPAALAALAVVAVYALAVARLLAVLQVFLRDIAAVIGQLLTLGFFLTPVLYDRTALPASPAQWLAWNPMAPPVEGLRAALTGAAVHWPALAASAAGGVLLLVLASAFLRRSRSHLEDFL
jgi:lipopolysaccharide transport system permease protein